MNTGIIRDGIVGIVTTQLGVERIPLLPQTEVPIFTTPLTDGVECSPEPLALGLRLHHAAGRNYWFSQWRRPEGRLETKHLSDLREPRRALGTLMVPSRNQTNSGSDAY